MISGISAAGRGLAAAQARFERAAGSIASEGDARTEAGGVRAPSVLDLAGAQREIISSKFMWSASLVALKTSTDMLAETIRIGGYGVDPAELR
jgi:hypothetical protein